MVIFRIKEQKFHGANSDKYCRLLCWFRPQNCWTLKHVGWRNSLDNGFSQSYSISRVLFSIKISVFSASIQNKTADKFLVHDPIQMRKIDMVRVFAYPSRVLTNLAFSIGMVLALFLDRNCGSKNHSWPQIWKT